MHIVGTVIDENLTWKPRFSLIKSRFLKPPQNWNHVYSKALIFNQVGDQNIIL